MKITHLLGVVSAALAVQFTLAGVNNPPAAPGITEPHADGQIVDAEDLHMQTGPFSDPDAGDTHVCTDWEIWLVSPSERAWVTACIGGVERLHTHLGDGTFENAHVGRAGLFPSTNYRLRGRHRDSSGDPATEWSPWSERLFTTAAGTEVFPLELEDVASAPTPTWRDTTGVAIDLPASATPSFLQLASADGQLLLEMRATASPGNILTNPPALTEHGALRVVLSAGAGGGTLVLPETDVAFQDDDGAQRTVYLPALSIPAGERRDFWVALSGATFWGAQAQTAPDFSTRARAAPTPWAVVQPGFVVETVATGFQLPVNLAFIPNPAPDADAPLFYVTELYGTIKVVHRDGTVGTYAGGLLNFNPTGEFPGSGEQGLTGLAVDAATGDVFVSLLYDSAPPSGAHYPRVMRFHSTDGGHTAASSQILISMVGESQGQSHQISNLSIGPDNQLYVHVGDGFDASTAQNLNSYRGKVLRMSLTGLALGDNPFYSIADGITSRDYIYAYGFRNPFGGAWRAADSAHYSVENGPSIDRMAKVSRGINYLWNGSDASMTNLAIYNWNPAHAPVNIAFVQPTTFGGSQFPASKQGHAFVSESGPTWATGPQSLGKRITEFVMNAGGAVTSGPTDLIVYNGAGKASAVGLAAGPDGLYFTDLYKDEGYSSPIDAGANVLRVRFVGTADFTADVQAGLAPLAVQFTNASSVPLATGYFWQFGDGGVSSAENPSHVFSADGFYDVRLSVTTPGGLVVTQKDNYIRVGQTYSIALIGGSAPPAAADSAVAAFLADRGFDVQTFDDEPANRPSAATLGAQFDCVIVSSTVTSSNIAGEFRTVPVPLITWENALLRSGRETLCDDGAVIAGASIDILDNTHFITRDLPLGAATVYSSAANLSVGRGNRSPNATLLATRSGAAGDYALMTAEQGVTLLGGYVTPERRVFLFLEDSSFTSATELTRTILERSVQWALRISPPPPPCPGDLDGDRIVDLSDLATLLAHFGVAGGAHLADGDLDADGDVDLTDLAILLANFGTNCG